MHPFPHRYEVRTTAAPDGDILLDSAGLPALPTTSPPEFDGPAGRWSPETLLVGSVADCFVLTFRAIARASKLSWTSLDVACTGTLERIDRVTQFTHFDLRARLAVADEVDDERARRLLAKAEETCLITRSLKAEVALTLDVVREHAAEEAGMVAAAPGQGDGTR